MIPLTVLGAVALAVALALFVATYFIQSDIFRYYCLGASTAILIVVSMQLLVAKFIVWPGALVFRKAPVVEADHPG